MLVWSNAHINQSSIWMRIGEKEIKPADLHIRWRKLYINITPSSKPKCRKNWIGVTPSGQVKISHKSLDLKNAPLDRNGFLLETLFTSLLLQNFINSTEVWVHKPLFVLERHISSVGSLDWVSFYFHGLDCFTDLSFYSLLILLLVFLVLGLQILHAPHYVLTPGELLELLEPTELNTLIRCRKFTFINYKSKGCRTWWSSNTEVLPAYSELRDTKVL